MVGIENKIIALSLSTGKDLTRLPSPSYTKLALWKAGGAVGVGVLLAPGVGVLVGVAVGPADVFVGVGLGPGVGVEVVYSITSFGRWEDVLASDDL